MNSNETLKQRLGTLNSEYDTKTKKMSEKLLINTFHYKLISAYQDVLDKCDQMSDTEEIKEAFEHYVSLLEKQAKINAR